MFGAKHIKAILKKEQENQSIIEILDIVTVSDEPKPNNISQTFAALSSIRINGKLVNQKRLIDGYSR